MTRPRERALDAKRVALVHVAKRRLAMEDADYRALLRRCAGVESASDLTDAGFRTVMDAFAALGFQSTSNRRNFGRRGDAFATAGQVATVRRLWAAYTGGTGTEAELGKWLERTFKVSALRFLPARDAMMAIIALGRMAERRASKGRSGGSGADAA